MATKNKPQQQLELPTNLKVGYLEGEQLVQVKAKHSKLSPVSETATHMAKKMLENNMSTGATIQLSNPALLSAKETIRKLLKRDLDRVVQRQ